MIKLFMQDEHQHEGIDTDDELDMNTVMDKMDVCCIIIVIFYCQISCNKIDEISTIVISVNFDLYDTWKL